MTAKIVSLGLGVGSHGGAFDVGQISGLWKRYTLF
jgi:hypothetical protein